MHEGLSCVGADALPCVAVPLHTPRAAAAHVGRSARPRSEDVFNRDARNRYTGWLNPTSSKPEGGCLDTLSAVRKTRSRTFSLYLSGSVRMSGASFLGTSRGRAEPRHFGRARYCTPLQDMGHIEALHCTTLQQSAAFRSRVPAFVARLVEVRVLPRGYFAHVLIR